MQRNDITGSVFGKLTVLEMIYGEIVNKRKRTKCKCLCECGSECTVLYDSLISGRKISCGCDTKIRRSVSNRKDLSGMKFGRLYVEEMIWDTRPSKASCICECGKRVVVIGTQLSSGKTQSCGCLQKEMASKANIKDWHGFRSYFGVEMLEPAYQNAKGQWMWRCKCGECGNEFIALPAKIHNGHTTSCGCRKRSSREQLIKTYLQELGLTYKEQYRFSECRDIYTLPFDFAILKDGNPSLLIEYDGIQHFKASNFFGGDIDFNNRLRKDKIKNEFCKSNNIPLLRLPYTLTDDEIKRQIINTIYP